MIINDNNHVSVNGAAILTALGGIGATLCGMKNGVRSCGASTRYLNALFQEYPVFETEFKPDSKFNDLSRTAQFVFHCFYEAMSDACISLDDIKNLRVGIFVGTTEGTSIDIMDTYRKIHSGEKNFDNNDERSLQKYLASSPAIALAFYLRENGVNVVFTQNVTNACSSGADAIGMGYLALLQNECDLVIAGGADSFSANTFAGFVSLLNADKSPCRPFDKNRGGLNLGEGAGLVIMTASARKHVSKKQEMGRVLGYGTCADAYHLTAPSPEGAGLSTALEMALRSAGKDYSEIAFINTHGTATETNDVAELFVINEKFRRKIPFLSTKGYTGHTLGAAGAIEAIVTLCHLNDRFLPASIGFSEPMDGFEHASPVKEITCIGGDTAVSFSLAFGGNNSVLVLGV